ncbi:MAG TPA: MRP family ATP-binding protein, partial [Bifidobacterium sp.]|nr:MRP family ATP-binding protein [Bifidobacterium sp.]
MTDERTIEGRIYERLSKVIDPELGRSITDLGMIASIKATPADAEGAYDVNIDVELTVEGCPLSQTITNQINGAVESYPDAKLVPHISVSSMSHDKLTQLVAGLKAERRRNPFNRPDVKTRIFAIASGKGGVGKSSVTANLAATFAALGYDTAAIDADIYGFSLPRLFGVHTQPT